MKAKHISINKNSIVLQLIYSLLKRGPEVELELGARYVLITALRANPGGQGPQGQIPPAEVPRRTMEHFNHVRVTASGGIQ